MWKRNLHPDLTIAGPWRASAHVFRPTVTSIACGCVSAPTAQRAIDPGVKELGEGFVSSSASANGTTLHYVRGGRGPAVVLLHGFPQDWYAFHKVMPRLARRFTVVSVDMRGVGGSAPITEGFDLPTLAKDIHALARHLDLEPVYLAGQDNGGIVAYAFARLFPSDARGVMILDVPLPGIEPWRDVKADPAVWHFGFHQTPDLPEQLISGREFPYFRAFFDRFALKREAIRDRDVAHYVKAYAGVERLRAGLEFYRRVYPGSEAFNAAARSRLSVPIVLVGGDHSMAPANTTIAEALREHGCEDVTVERIKDSGHWVIDEQPDAVATLIERYAAVGRHGRSTPAALRNLGVRAPLSWTRGAEETQQIPCGREVEMLQNSNVAARIPAQDLERARSFYSSKLGLEPVEERPGGLRYRCGSGHFSLFQSSGSASGSHTQMAWEVDDIEAAVKELRRRGVVFEEYDLPGLKTINGIAEITGNYPSNGGVGEKGAWFRDSEGNLLSVGQAISGGPSRRGVAP
jgi:pimeloyl-ACP methyl ester carboxylesterase/catechol 2,3-dioxygenase-like lactoylglutathione lyase family enzyme